MSCLRCSVLVAEVKVADFRPPTMYYTNIPLVSERPHNRRWDASKLRELRKRMDSNTITDEEIEQVAADFLDGEIVDLASDWLGNTVSFFKNVSPELSSLMSYRLSRSFSKSAPYQPVWPCLNVSVLTWR
jgi:hypothetical protein